MLLIFSVGIIIYNQQFQGSIFLNGPWLAPFFRGELLNFGCSFYFNLKITLLTLPGHPSNPTSPPPLQRWCLPNQHVSDVSHWRRHQMTSCKVEESASGSELVVSEYRKLKKKHDWTPENDGFSQYIFFSSFQGSIFRCYACLKGVYFCLNEIFQPNNHFHLGCYLFSYAAYFAMSFPFHIVKKDWYI